MNSLLLMRTVRHLKPVQIYGRAYDKLWRPSPRPEPAPPVRTLLTAWTPPVPRARSLTGPAQVRFLNEDGAFVSAADWNAKDRSRLWLYNLHYFDGLTAEDGDDPAWRRSMVARWVAENPLGHGAGWEPYPTSLRIVNWVKWALGGAALEPAGQDSLALQARWLAGRVEWRLLGNHLLANAKALVFAGLYFEGAEAEGWLAAGLRILQGQLPEQILADGGHFERSPMYHATILEDALDLINLGRASGAVNTGTLAAWERMAEAMLGWLQTMTHPDGEIGLFNDAAFSIAPTFAELAAYAVRLGVAIPPPETGATWLEASGYARLAEGEAVVLIDAAPVGPDHQPGHAHADTLSFELSIGCERIVVNGGTSTYSLGPQRDAERATAAHSTVEVDSENSSEVWAGFRVGRRARIVEAKVAATTDGLTAEAAHDGYRWLKGRPIHRRAWRLHANRLTVQDTIEGRAASAIARFHFGPGVRAQANSNALGGELTTPSGRILRWTTDAPATVRPSRWSPEFGKRVETCQLVAPFTGPTLRTEFTW